MAGQGRANIRRCIAPVRRCLRLPRYILYRVFLYRAFSSPRPGQGLLILPLRSGRVWGEGKILDTWGYQNNRRAPPP